MTDMKQFNIKWSILFLGILLAGIVLITLTLWPEGAFSQPSFPDDPDQIPVDGGLAALFAAGAGYAIRSMKKSRRSEE